MATENNPVATMLEQLGMNENLSVNSSESDLDNQEDTQDENSTVTDTVNTDTETEEKETTSFEKELLEIKKQLEVNNKRLSDKDRFIEELKGELRDLREGKSQEKVESNGDSESSFWDDPEGTIKRLSEELRVANIRIDESTFASNKPDYWDIVTADNLKEAFTKDAEFLDEFTSSKRPYEVAYNYLVSKQTESKSSFDKLVEERVNAKLKEMGISEKAKKETIPNIGNSGSSSSSNTKLEDNDYMSVFRRKN